MGLLARATCANVHGTQRKWLQGPNFPQMTRIPGKHPENRLKAELHTLRCLFRHAFFDFFVELLMTAMADEFRVANFYFIFFYPAANVLGNDILKSQFKPKWQAACLFLSMVS